MRRSIHGARKSIAQDVQNSARLAVGLVCSPSLPGVSRSFKDVKTNEQKTAVIGLK
jgi:hypothetical protein